MVLLSATLAARHLVVAYSSKTLIRIVLFFGLLMVGSIFLGVYWPAGLYVYNVKRLGERAAGFFGDPNEAGYNCVLVVAICYALLAAEHKYRTKLLVLVGIFFATVAAFLTYSRGAIITYVILSGAQLFWASKTNRKIIFLIGIASTTLMVGYILSQATNKNRSDRENRMNRLNKLITGDISDGARGRIHVASYAIKRWAKSPILGRGLGAGSKDKEIGSGAHNTYIQVLTEAGIIPFCLLGLFSFVFIIESIKCKDPGVRTLCLGVAVVTFLACATTHGIFHQIHHTLFLGVCFGALSGVKYLEKNKTQPLNARRRRMA